MSTPRSEISDAIAAVDAPSVVVAPRQATTDQPVGVPAGRATGTHAAATGAHPVATGGNPAVSGSHRAVADGLTGAHAAVDDPATVRRRFARRLATKLAAHLEDAEVRTVLLTSPNDDVGKSTLARMLGPELERIAPERFLIVDWRQIGEFDPDLRDEGLTVIVDGPAMMEGDGALTLPEKWMTAFDGALIVVLGRKTRKGALVDTVEWLRAADIPPLAILYNERDCPAPPIRWLRFLDWLQLPSAQKLDVLLGRRSVR